MAPERRLERGLGPIPLLVRAEPLLRPRRQLRARRHAEPAVERAGEVDHPVDLVLDLLLRDEDVRVVLRDVPHPQQAVQRPAALVAVERRRLRVPDRQVAVRAQPRSEEEHVAGAVHRLQRERLLALVRLHEEHVLRVVLVVARRDVRLQVVQERRLHLAVAAAQVLSAAEVLERVPDHHALRVPERRARRVLGEVEEVELAAELAVVARPRLLEPLEIGVEIGLRVERRPVDARQLRVPLVAAPVRAGELVSLTALIGSAFCRCGPRQRSVNVSLRVEGDRALPRRSRAPPCTAAPPPRSARARPRATPPRASTRVPPRSRAGSPPRSA